MPKYEWTNASERKPFAVTGLAIALDGRTGTVRVQVSLEEVVGLRWNAVLGRWEWYEGGQWVS